MKNPQIETMQREIAQLQKDIRRIIELSVRSEIAGGIATYTYADLPSPSRQGLLAIVTNGRKAGEGAGAGTGVFAVTLNIAGTITWTRVDDFSAVVI